MGIDGMKSIAFSAVVLAIISISQVTTASESSLVLVEDRQPRFVIVTEDDPPLATYEVLAELNTWIRKITGVNLRVVRESAWDGMTPYISVGHTKLAEQNGWSAGPFEQEEARIFIESNRIGLLGNDEPAYVGSSRRWNGTYYAVVEFIRKRLGVYWIWPGELGEVYDTRHTLEIELGTWSWVPKIKLVRELAYYDSVRFINLAGEYFQYSAANPEAYVVRNALVEDTHTWAKRQRMGRVPHVNLGHSFTDWWSLYGKDHPDWFAKPPARTAQMGGEGVKFNLSNPELQNQMFDTWKQAWEDNPHRHKFFPISPNDSRGFDTRPETRAWDAPELARYSDKEIWNSREPILSDRYVKFWNIIARRVKEVDPDVRLLTLAYRNYQAPPLGDERIEDNIVLAYHGGEGYYPDDRHLRDEWIGWTERGASLVWRPNLLHSGHGTPYLFSRMVYEDYQFLQEHGMVGVLFDSLAGHWGLQGLTYYVLAELFSRAEASYEQLAGEYFGAFGPASAAIREFHEFFEERTAQMPAIMRSQNLVPNETWGGWWGAHIRIIPYLLTSDVVSHADALIKRAEEAVADFDAPYRERVGVVKTAFEHAKLMATTFRRLRLDHPNIQMPYEQARHILQPLWDFRLDMSSSPYLVSTVFRSMALEERQLGIWKVFRHTAASQIAHTNFEIALSENDWSFRGDPTNKGVEERWYKDSGGQALGWSSIKIGMPWRTAVRHGDDTRIGWYRVTFDAPEQADTGGRVYLYFKSVDAEMKLWLNGTLVNERAYPHNANYDSWNEPFQVDVTDYIQYGSRNSAVVRVESESHNAGITGAVSLLIER